MDDPVDPPAPSAPTVDDDPAVYCVPAPEPKPEPEPGALGAPGVPSMLGLPQGAAQGAARRRQEEQPAIAEMGPPPSPGEETGAVLAESGSW
ncbi:hypothetical protein [Prescottella defluvii]|uniref:hypothetical protein n=1 Tax=Prescottella defluvii TaxID=1323361 RepID=UPI0004F2D069|nr:hypothetical protein [Prescottella defluvii]